MEEVALCTLGALGVLGALATEIADFVTFKPSQRRAVLAATKPQPLVVPPPSGSWLRHGRHFRCHQFGAREDLSVFCAQMIDCVLEATFKFRTLRVRCVERFEGEANGRLEYQVPRGTSALVVLPLSRHTVQIDSLRTDDKTCLVVVWPCNLEIEGTDFMVVALQDFKAWDP